MKRFCSSVLLTLLSPFLFYQIALAGNLYTYTDENGVVCITSNPTEAEKNKAKYITKSGEPTPQEPGKPDKEKRVKKSLERRALRAADSPLGTLPMYGGLRKTPAMIRADQAFISSMTAKFGSREEAARQIMIVGWRSIRANDWQTAMKRFNQAWLLTPASSDVFWGFGATLACAGKFEESIKYFTKADRMSPNNARLLCDFGRVYQQYAVKKSRSKEETSDRLGKSIELFEQAASLDSGYHNIYQNWAVSLYYKGDYRGSLGEN